MVLTAVAALNGHVPDNLPVLISRPKNGAMLGGVCAGLARRWQIDPHLLRIAVVVLSFFGGLGLAAYGAAMLLMPRDGQAEMPVRRYLPFTRSWSGPAVVAATIGAAVVLLGITGSSGFGLAPVVIIFAIWFFGFRNRGVHHPSGPAKEPTPFERTAAAWRQRLAEQQTPGFENVPQTPSPVQRTTQAFAPVPQVASSEQRWIQPYTEPVTELEVRDNEPTALVVRRSRQWHLWWLALTLAGAGVMVVTVLGFAGWPVGPLSYAAAVLAGLAITLIVAARSGRPPLLLPATFLTALVTAGLMGSASGVPFQGVGEITRAYTNSADLPAELNLSAGEVALDLSRMQLAADRDLTIHVGAGSVDLTLPSTAASEVTWKVKAGDFDAADGESQDGLDISGIKNYPAATLGAPTLHVTVSVDLGDVDVRR